MATATNPNLPGMTDTLDFVKNLWGSMNVPGFSVPGMPGPTLSTDELDKKISDLKAVESWLNLNTTMLRGTIQALEVQRATLATFKSMSASMAQAMGQPGADGKPGPAQFGQFFNQPGAGAPAAEAAAPEAQGAAAGAAPEAPPGTAAMPAALAWWNLLQDQFQQAVTGAMSAQATPGATGPEAGAGSPAAPGAAPGQDAASAAAKPRASKPRADKS